MGDIRKKTSPEHLADELDAVGAGERDGAFVSDKNGRSLGFYSVSRGVGDSSIDELFKNRDPQDVRKVGGEEAQILADAADIYQDIARRIGDKI